jgi:N-acetyl-beta-hexosaminidase
MAFPRAIALAEKAWTPVDRHDYDDFLLRLTEQVKRLDVMEVDYRPLDSSFTPGFNAGIR